MHSESAACRQCGEIHVLEDLELTYVRPDMVVELPDDERQSDVKESNDLCVVRGEHFFVRATLPLPVLGRDQPYRLGVWVETSEANFRRILDLWVDEDQASEPALDVTLANSVATVPETRGVPALLRLTGPTTRPDVFLAEGGHPMADLQREGISDHRAYQFTASVGARPVVQEPEYHH